MLWKQYLKNKAGGFVAPVFRGPQLCAVGPVSPALGPAGSLLFWEKSSVALQTLDSVSV